LTNLGVLIEGDVLHLAQSPTKDIPRMYTVIGRRAVAHCTALGKVLLASRPWAEVRALIRQYGWRPYTPHSIRNFQQLQEELEKVNKEGYAVDREERRLGVRCVAAPIRDRGGTVIAAVSASSTADRLNKELIAGVLPSVIDTAHRISFRLGHQVNPALL
jgi:IclR family acetate operon transcriptional repressor